MADVYGRSPKPRKTSSYPKKNTNKKSSKKSGDTKLAAFNASHSSEPSKPTIKKLTEEERKANQLITSSVSRSKGEDRTKEALNDIKVKDNNDKAKEAFEKANGNIPAMPDFNIKPPVTPKIDNVKDSKANDIISIITKPRVSDNVVGASVIDTKSIKDKITKLMHKDEDPIPVVYTSDQIAEMSVGEKVLRGTTPNQLDQKWEQQQKAAEKKEQESFFGKIRNIDERASEYVPTLNDISQSGKKFRQKHPEAADLIYNSLNFGAGVAKKGAEEIDKDLGNDIGTKAGTAVGEFSVGMYDGVREKPVSTVGKTVLWAVGPGVIGKVAGSAGKVVVGTKVGSQAAKIVSPVTSKISSEAAIKAAEVGFLGVYGKHMKDDIEAPIVTYQRNEDGTVDTITRDPTLEEKSHRAGELFGTDVVPMAAGFGIAKAFEKPLANRQWNKEFEARYENPSTLTQVDGPRNARRMLDGDYRYHQTETKIFGNPKTNELRFTERTKVVDELNPVKPGTKFVDDFDDIVSKPKNNIISSEVKVFEKGSTKAKKFEFEMEAPLTKSVKVKKGRVTNKFELEVPVKDTKITFRKTGRVKKLKSEPRKESIWRDERAQISVGEVRSRSQMGRSLYGRVTSTEIQAEKTILFGKGKRISKVGSQIRPVLFTGRIPTFKNEFGVSKDFDKIFGMDQSFRKVSAKDKVKVFEPVKITKSSTASKIDQAIVTEQIFETSTTSDTSNNPFKPTGVKGKTPRMPPIIPLIPDFDDKKIGSRRRTSTKSGKTLRVKNKMRTFEEEIGGKRR